MRRAILDTNLFVAAGFNPGSASARLLREAEAGRLALIWNQATRRETRAVLGRIPRLRWATVEPLFRPEGEHPGAGDLSAACFVADPDDRKFAALAMASGAPLVSADSYLLAHRDRLDVATPGEFLDRQLEAGEAEPRQQTQESMARKMSTGPNARPKDETIAQSGAGLPDDSSQSVEEVTSADEAAARRGLEALGERGGRGGRPGRAQGESAPGAPSQGAPPAQRRAGAAAAAPGRRRARD